MGKGCSRKQTNKTTPTFPVAYNRLAVYERGKLLSYDLAIVGTIIAVSWQATV